MRRAPLPWLVLCLPLSACWQARPPAPLPSARFEGRVPAPSAPGADAGGSVGRVVREAMYASADTCQDFYRYACGGWIDRTELPGFEQDDYAPAAQSDKRSWEDLLAELELVRRGNILMFRGLPHEAWLRRGVASRNEMSVRALAYNIAGHELHHMKVIREKYL